LILTELQREAFVRAIFEEFGKLHGGHALEMYASSEYELARKWAQAGVPLATVLQGIRETAGKPRKLSACERSVEEQIRRWHSAMPLTSLPAAGPLEEP